MEETARRETREEAGLEVEQVSLFGVFSGPELYHRYPNGHEVYNVTVVFRADRWSGSPQSDGLEATETAFFASHELPAQIPACIAPIISTWRRVAHHQ